MSKKEKNMDHKEYNRILESIRLSRVYLKSSSCDLKERHIGETSIDPFISEKCESEIHEGGFTIDYTYKLAGKVRRKNAVVLQCTLAVEFSSEEEITHDFIEFFEEISAKFLTAPYAREFFSAMTTRMDLPAFFLPLFKIGPSEE